MNWIEKASDILSPLDEPLQSVIIRSGNQHSDETTLKCCDQRLPGRQEKESDVEPGTLVDTTSRAESIKIRQFLLITSTFLGRLSANGPKVTAYHW